MDFADVAVNTLAYLMLCMNFRHERKLKSIIEITKYEHTHGGVSRSAFPIDIF
jgi:hypothetical protein